jgi:predicted nucleic acid-binding protein
MNVYFDSGALVKLYVKEHHSEEVITIAYREKQIFISQLHELEIKNALRAQCGRGAILEEECEKAISAFNEDVEERRLKLFYPDWNSIYGKAEELSNMHTVDILCRAIDILHVASAVFFSSSLFVTGDKRQATLASEAGLDVSLIGGEK